MALRLLLLREVVVEVGGGGGGVGVPYQKKNISHKRNSMKGPC